MVILIDVNIILDHLIPRQPFADIADEVLSLCVQQIKKRLCAITCCNEICTKEFL